MEGEGLAKVLFWRLDPLLRILSAVIERYVQLEEDGEIQHNIVEKYTQDVFGQNQVPREEKLIGLLKMQVQLLDSLRSELHDLVSKPEHCVALGHISQYVMLPLQAILKSYNKPAGNSSRQSQLWKSQEGAATVLTQVLRLCPSSSISLDLKLLLLPLCVFAMNASKTTDTVGPETASLRRLDRGEEHDKALLRCLLELLRENAGIPGADIGTMHNGNVMAYLVAGCIEIVSPSPDSDPNLQDTELVTDALLTLGMLLDRVPNRDQWRAIFPGCSAALIDRSLARSKTGGITASSVERLSQLLAVTLRSAVDTNTSEDVLLQLSKLTVQGHTRVEADGDAFVKKCRSRLPGPLSALITMLPSSTSAKVRMSALVLCRTLLTDTSSIWNDTTLGTQALQCCIIIRNDSDHKVKDFANETLDLLRASGFWNDAEFVFAAFDIIADLPTVARSLRDVELRSKVRLAQGYLELCMNGDSTSRICDMLTAHEEQSCLRHALAGVFDMDFESLQQSPKVFLLTSQFGSSSGIAPTKFRFLRDDTVALAMNLVSTLGRVLGPKGGCLFVDACIADLHESCVLRVERGLGGTSQVSWVHEWIGIVVVAEQALVGFTGSNYGKGNEERRTRKRVKALAAALIPLLVDSPLWILPTVHEAAGTGTQTIADSSVSVEALRGNAAMLCSLLTFIGTMVHALGSDIALSTPLLLYPLFERCSVHNHSRVQAAAQSVIEAIAKASRSKTVNELVSSNFDYLFGSLQSKLRNFAVLAIHGSKVLGYLSAIAKSILNSGMAQPSNRKPVNIRRSLESRNNATIIIKTAKDITVLFDRSVLKVGESHDVNYLLDLIDFYDGSLLCIMDSFGLTPKTVETRKHHGGVPDRPWMALMKPFSLTGTSPGGRLEITRDASDSEEKTHMNIDISSSELVYVTMVLARCGYLISHPTLTLRVSSCKVLSMAFAFLGFIADNYVKDEDKEAGEHPGNAIYRQISDSWPAIQSRLEALSNEFCDSQRSTSLLLRVSNALPTPYSSSNLLFLSTLFDLVGAMAYSSGSFMWGRLEGEVWPLCACILETRLQERRTSSSVITDEKAPVSDKNKLLRSLLSLYTKVFRNPELAERAASSIPTIGTMILPFISDEDPIGETAMETMKAMLCIDCDVLWRSLLSTSGRGLPSNPYDESEIPQRQESEVVVQEASQGSLLQKRAQELLDFANALPEQNIEWH